MITIDFETRSACDLLLAGAQKYARDPTTEVMCLAYKVGDSPVRLWHPEFKNSNVARSPIPTELIEAINSGELVEAHNAGFEYAIWEHVLRPLFPYFPEIHDDNWRCSAAKASFFTLPRSLANACKALRLPIEKDMEGNRLMRKMCKPKNMNAAQIKEYTRGRLELPEVLIYHETREDLGNLFKYCKTDVDAEHALSGKLKELGEMELAYWQMDQRMNRRGVQGDRAVILRAIDAAADAVDMLNNELCEITGGEVQKATARNKLKDYCASRGLVMENTKAEYIAELLACDDLPEGTRRVLEICSEGNKTSVTKYIRMLGQLSADDRIRDTQLYYGASRTGRWCNSGDHEVLTDNGWVRFDEWGGGDIAQWSPDGAIELLPAIRVDFPYEGEMVRLEGRKYSLLATPDHKIPYFTRRFNTTTAEQLPANTTPRLPIAGNLKGNFCDPLLTRVVVMGQADGCVIKDLRYKDPRTVFRFGFTKKRKIERCISLLKALNIQYTVYIESAGNRATRIRIPNPPEYLIQSKTFGPWLLEHNPETFLNELPFWDGSTDKRAENPGFEYSTCSKNNAEWVKTMGHLAGRYVSVKPRNRDVKSGNTIYRVFVSHPKTHLVSRPSIQSTREPFKGKVYCAETATGFFMVRHKGKISITGNSGKGVQPHNYARGFYTNATMDGAANDLLKYTPEQLTILYGSVMKFLSSLARGALRAEPGRKLAVADFSAIEARVLLWLVGDERGLDIFRSGEDIYEDMASGIFRVDLADVTKDQRQVGKQAILGLGYSMGAETFDDTCLRNAGITRERKFFASVVKVYRKEKFPKVSAYWGEVENAALEALQHKGRAVKCKRIAFKFQGRALYCRLPSGRCLVYYEPTLRKRLTWYFEALNEKTQKMGRIMVTTKAGVSKAYARKRAEFMGSLVNKVVTSAEPENMNKLSISFMHDVKGKWVRGETYGGKLVENITQATARDLLAEAMLRVDKSDKYDVLMAVHDEIISEADEGVDLEEFENLMAEVPEWAKGCPLGATGWVGDRYRKD